MVGTAHHLYLAIENDIALQKRLTVISTEAPVSSVEDRNRGEVET
jgi:hypothetical protein